MFCLRKYFLTYAPRYGKELVRKNQAFKSADRDVRELILCVEDHWIKFEYQIPFLQGVWNCLDERLQVHQHHLLQTLQTKLQEANDLVDSAIGTQVHRSTIAFPSRLSSSKAFVLCRASSRVTRALCLCELGSSRFRILIVLIFSSLAQHKRTTLNSIPASPAMATCSFPPEIPAPLACRTCTAVPKP